MNKRENPFQYHPISSNMGKNKPNTNNKNNDKCEQSSDNIKKMSKTHTKTEKLASIINTVGMPTSAEGLTADQLTENQKHALKKVCAQMHGHQHSTKKALPARSLESATVQLAQKMKEKLAQHKKNQQKQKKK